MTVEQARQAFAGEAEWLATPVESDGHLVFGGIPGFEIAGHRYGVQLAFKDGKLSRIEIGSSFRTLFDGIARHNELLDLLLEKYGAPVLASRSDAPPRPTVEWDTRWRAPQGMIRLSRTSIVERGQLMTESLVLTYTAPDHKERAKL